MLFMASLASLAALVALLFITVFWASALERETFHSPSISLNVSAGLFSAASLPRREAKAWLKLKKVAQLQRSVAYTIHMHEPSAMNQSLLKSTNYVDANADVNAKSLRIGRRPLRAKEAEEPKKMQARGVFD